MKPSLKENVDLPFNGRTFSLAARACSGSPSSVSSGCGRYIVPWKQPLMGRGAEKKVFYYVKSNYLEHFECKCFCIQIRNETTR